MIKRTALKPFPPETKYQTKIHPSSHHQQNRRHLSTYLIIKHRILLPQTRHERILRQRVLPAATILLPRPPHLFLQRLHIRRQQSVQAEVPPLARGEGAAFVEEGRVEECGALVRITCGLVFGC